MEKRVNIFWYIVCFHLPSYRRCPSSFLKGLLNGTKSVSKEYLYLGHAFKLYEIEKQHIPPFAELGVKKLWNHFKRNKTVCNYMPEYPEKQIPEREFFFGVLCTLYPKVVGRIVEAAYKARNQKHEESKDDMIEMTKLAKEAIDSVLTYKSKTYFSY